MKPAFRLAVIAITAMLILAAAGPLSVEANTPSLCAYWQPNITQWADLITQYATDNGLDPNLVAAVVEEESKGNPNLTSPAGAVGLLQIMPYEAGFTWRPHGYTLRKPAANLEWGTHTLNEIVRQAQGRITLAVMAYNSGWDRIQLRATRLFAAKVFDHYARCILSQAGSDYKSLSDYTVYIVAHSSAGTTHVDRFRSSGVFEPMPTFEPESLQVDLPHTVAFSQLDEDHIAWWVEVWVDARPTVGEALSNAALRASRPNDN
jgi:hypothetical protein